MDASMLTGKEMVVDAPSMPSSDVRGNKEAGGNAASRTFGDLPTEIRLLVWHLCIPEGRMIKVKAWAYERTSDQYRFRLQMEEDRSIPVLFNICHETREIAQKVFILGFENIRDTEKLYWNPESDFFYLNLRTFRFKNPSLSRIKTLQTSLHLVQNLGLKMGSGLWYSLTRGACVEWLHGFSSLKHLRLIVDPRESCGPWDWMSSSDFFSIPEEEEEDAPDRTSASDVPVQSRPAFVQYVVERKFEQYRAMNRLEWMPPIIEVYHMPDSESSSRDSS